MTAGDKQSGFTLIELLVTIAVIIIMATIAFPSFQNMIARNQVASDYNEILSGLKYARSEAIKRRENIGLNIVNASPPWKYEVILVDESGADPLRVRESGNGRVALSVANDFTIEFEKLGKLESGADCDGGCLIELSQPAVGCQSVISISSFGRVGKGTCSDDT